MFYVLMGANSRGVPMRIVLALGGNALLERGQPLTAENQRINIKKLPQR